MHSKKADRSVWTAHVKKSAVLNHNFLDPQMQIIKPHDIINVNNLYVNNNIKMLQL